MTNPNSSLPQGLWQPHSHDAAAAVAALSQGVLATVDMAAGLAMGGRRVDVAGLDRAVGLLCAKALDLPPAEGHAACAGLFALLTQMDALSLALRTTGSS